MTEPGSEAVEPTWGTDQPGATEPGMGTEPDMGTEPQTEPELQQPMEMEQDYTAPPPYVSAAPAPYYYDADQARYRPPSGAGLGLTLGGGVTGFVNDSARTSTDVGGAWGARLTIGTRSIIGGEVAYTGSAQNLDALGLDNSAYLLSNSAEGAARLNFLTEFVQPYVLAGTGVTFLSVQNADFNQSAINDSDTVMHFPLGAGVALLLDGAIIDLRGVVRPTLESNMFGPTNESLTSWSANLSAGWEF
jgi:hypothetical protein